MTSREIWASFIESVKSLTVMIVQIYVSRIHQIIMKFTAFVMKKYQLKDPLKVGAMLKGVTTMPDTLGERLKAIRKEKGLKQYKLAEKIGIYTSQLSRFERGLTIPNVATLEWICKALNVSASELLGW